MVETDILIGFETRPEGLEGFLESEGYSLEASHNNSQSYVHDEHGLTNLDYYPEFVQAEDEVPDWKNAGYNLASLLNISFPINESDSIDEGNRIAKVVTQKFNGIYYDSNLKEFFRGSQL